MYIPIYFQNTQSVNNQRRYLLMRWHFFFSFFFITGEGKQQSYKTYLDSELILIITSGHTDKRTSRQAGRQSQAKQQLRFRVRLSFNAVRRDAAQNLIERAGITFAHFHFTPRHSLQTQLSITASHILAKERCGSRFI